MKQLTILYDEECQFCVRCRWWLARQPSFIPLEFIPQGSPLVRERYPQLVLRSGKSELIVVADDGTVYRNDDAFLICLYALKEYRQWSQRLAEPSLRPLAHAFFKEVSARRATISSWLGAPSKGAGDDEDGGCSSCQT